MAIAYNFAGPRIVSDGLVLYMDAANPNSYNFSTPLTWRDISRNRNNGTLVNGVGYSSANGGNLIFDGNDDYTQQTNDLLLGTNFTISLVFKQTATRSDWVRLFGHGNNGERFWGIWMPDNRGYLLWQSYSNGGQVSSSGYTFNLNTVYNIVLTSAGSTRTFYVNGVLLSTHSIGGTINYGSTTEKIRIGYAGFHTYFVGSVYNASIYNKTLTSAEILQNYNALKERYGI